MKEWWSKLRSEVYFGWWSKVAAFSLQWLRCTTLPPLCTAAHTSVTACTRFTHLFLFIDTVLQMLSSYIYVLIHSIYTYFFTVVTKLMVLMFQSTCLYTGQACLDISYRNMVSSCLIAFYKTHFNFSFSSG